MNPTIEQIVARMKSGTTYRVGREEYRWHNNELRVVEGAQSHAISEGQLRQVVASHTELFGGTKPTLRDVIDRMKKGERFQYGGGRMFEVFGWDKQLYVDSVVDGEESRSSCTEARLAEAIAESPQVFTDVRYK